MTDDDGRIHDVLEGRELVAGVYRLSFELGRGALLRGRHGRRADRGRQAQLPRAAARCAVRAEHLPRVVTSGFVPLPDLDELDADACAAALAPLFEGAPRFLARLAADRPVRRRGDAVRARPRDRARDARSRAGRADRRAPAARRAARLRVRALVPRAGLRPRGRRRCRRGGARACRGGARAAERGVRGAVRVPLLRVRRGPAARGAAAGAGGGARRRPRMPSCTGRSMRSSTSPPIATGRCRARSTGSRPRAARLSTPTSRRSARSSSTSHAQSQWTDTTSPTATSPMNPAPPRHARDPPDLGRPQLERAVDQPQRHDVDHELVPDPLQHAAPSHAARVHDLDDLVRLLAAHQPDLREHVEHVERVDGLAADRRRALEPAPGGLAGSAAGTGSAASRRAARA